jgi:hypothetical protein
MPRTDIEQRWAIVAAWKQLRSTFAASKLLKTPVRIVKRWVARYKATKNVLDAQRSGRPRALEDAPARRALELLLSNHHGSAKMVAQEIWKEGNSAKLLSRCTIIRAARRASFQQGIKIKALRGKPKKKLTAPTMHRRLAFCSATLRRSWDTVMFTDRKKFTFYHPNTRVHQVTWVEQGQDREAHTVNHAQVVNVYAGLTKFGVTKPHIVTGTTGHQTTFKNKQGHPAKNITSSEYKCVLKDTLLEEGSRIFRNRGFGTWTLQQDNDPTHKVAKQVVDAYNKDKGSSVQMINDWPPNSPDLSPIENLWAYIQARLDARGCANFQQFKLAVAEEMKAVPINMAASLVDSMPKRVAICKRLGGGKTKY